MDTNEVITPGYGLPKNKTYGLRLLLLLAPIIGQKNFILFFLLFTVS